jgi:hypothetical protein
MKTVKSQLACASGDAFCLAIMCLLAGLGNFLAGNYIVASFGFLISLFNMYNCSLRYQLYKAQNETSTK